MYKFVSRRTRIIMYIIDAIGYALWLAWRALRPWTWLSIWQDSASYLHNPQRILLIRADYIGDVLLTTHTLRAIRTQYPCAQITMLCSEKGAEILHGNPYLDDIIAYNPPWFFKKPWCSALREYMSIRRRIQQERIDLGVDFRGDLRNIVFMLVATNIPFRVSFAASGGWYLLQKKVAYVHGLHEAEYHTLVAQAVGASILATDHPQIFPSKEDRLQVDTFCKQHILETHPEHKSPIVAITPGARKEVRLWPLQRYAEVARKLQEEFGARIILVGAPQDQDHLNALNTLLPHPVPCTTHGLTNLRQLYELFLRCSLFIGVSSGPSHVAAAANLTSVLLFGPELQSQWQPLGPTHIIQHVFPCMPCTQKKCLYNEANCIHAITATEVLHVARQALTQLTQSA